MASRFREARWTSVHGRPSRHRGSTSSFRDERPRRVLPHGPEAVPYGSRCTNTSPGMDRCAGITHVGISKVIEGGCKPDSVLPSERRSFILAAGHPAARAADPEASPRRSGLRGRTALCFPIWPCSARGLPCLPRHRESGALLPHPFTLTPVPARGRSPLCGTFPRVTTAGRYPACCPPGVRTFLSRPQPEANARLLRSPDQVYDVTTGLHTGLHNTISETFFPFCLARYSASSALTSQSFGWPPQQRTKPHDTVGRNEPPDG